MAPSALFRELSAQRWGSLPRTAPLFKFSGDRQHHFLLPGPPDNLHPDRKAFGRIAHWNDNGRETEQVKPLAVAPGIEIFHGPAFDLPLAFAMPECRDSGGGTYEHGIRAHLEENSFAHGIAPQPGGKQGFPGGGGRILTP